MKLVAPSTIIIYGSCNVPRHNLLWYTAQNTVSPATLYVGCLWSTFLKFVSITGVCDRWRHEIWLPKGNLSFDVKFCHVFSRE